MRKRKQRDEREVRREGIGLKCFVYIYKNVSMKPIIMYK